MTWSPANLRTIGLDDIRAPFVPTKVSLTSSSVGALTLKARAAVEGDRTSSYEVRCVARITAVTRIYPGSGTTRTGFRSGNNACRVRALNAAGASPGWPSTPSSSDPRRTPRVKQIVTAGREHSPAAPGFDRM